MIKKLYFILATTIIYLIFFSSPVYAQTNQSYHFNITNDFNDLKTIYYSWTQADGRIDFYEITKIEFDNVYYNKNYINYKGEVKDTTGSMKVTAWNTYFNDSSSYINNYPTLTWKSTEPISEEDFNNMKTFKEIEEEEKEKENGNGNSGENNTDNGETGGTGTDGDNSDSGNSEDGEDDNGNQGNTGEQGTDTEQGNNELDGKSTELLEYIYNAIIMQNFVTSLLFGACVCGFAIKLKF